MKKLLESELVNDASSENLPDLGMTRRRQSRRKDKELKMETSEDNDCEISPTVSRYGRARKPKLSEDFLPTDKKVGALLGLSPKKSTTPSPNVTPRKARDKGIIQNDLKEKDGKRRGKPKLILHSSPKFEEKSSADHVSTNTSFSEDKKVLDSPAKASEQQRMSVRPKLTPNADNEENVDGGARHSPVPLSVKDILEDNDRAKPPINEPVLNDESDTNCDWKPGDLAWARIAGHPFWPCMIATDLQSGLFTKTKRSGRGGHIAQRSLHVLFYGDNGRHCWISTGCVIRFEGRENLHKFADKVLSEIKKKDKKYSSAFVVRPSAQSAWDCAVREAEEALPQSREERIRYFRETFPPPKEEDDSEQASESTEVDSIGRSRKRKRSSFDSGNKVLKRMKTEESISEVKEKTVRIGSPSRKKSKKVPNKKKKRKKVDAFSAYCDKFYVRVSELNPELSAQEIKDRLVKSWSELSDTEKAEFGSRNALCDGKTESDLSGEEEEDTNDNLSTSTRTSGSNLCAPVLKKRGGGGLFRGTRIEKVCQLCLKPGNTVKCKGPCLGVFHLDCIKNPAQAKAEAEGGQTKGKNKRLSKVSKIVIQIKTEGGGTTDVDKSSESGETCDAEKDGSEKDDGKQSQNEDESSENNDSGEFRCKDCSENRPPPCFVCCLESDPKTNNITRVRCSVAYCGKFYHMECLAAWPQTSCSGGLSRRPSTNSSKGAGGKAGESSPLLTCPQHVCHTCASDDPRNATMRFNQERLVRCVLCPTAYHTGSYCVPAGSEILTGSQIVCSRHYVPPPKVTHHVNAAWCFICAVGGSLICCDLCPASFHAECVHITTPEEGYICEDCDTGRFPLYGEVVWVKLGAYRWWPAQILFPNEVPDNIDNIAHSRGEFAVKFFGTRDYHWVNRGRVFLYQEGDTGVRSAKKTGVDGSFQKALIEALEAYKKMRGERSQKEAEARPGMKPPAYVRIKSNRPVGNVRVNDPDPASMTPCDCKADSENPCGFGSDCINRILMVECNPSVCPAGSKCGNQCFTKREYPPLEPFRTEGRGWGLRALKDLRKGEFVIEYVGEMIDEEEYKKRLECKHKEKDENYYFLTIDKDRMLDAGPKGNVARFMNHSCQPNCETQKWTVNGDTHVGLFALKDIPVGEELTFNYNLECVGTDKKPCMCGAPNCSGFIGTKVSKIVEDDKKLKGKSELLKRRKKRPNTKSGDAVCFKCGDGGELLLCGNKTCPKGYHLSCAKRRVWPQGKWTCPWHFCNICKKRTASRCGFCPNSFCGRHVEGNIRFNSEHGTVCQEHDVVTEVTESGSANENTSKTVNDTPNKKTEDASKSKSLGSVCSFKSFDDSKENDKSRPKRAKKPKVKVEPEESVPNTSGSQTDGSICGKKKRGRPRKYPVGATPEMILKIKQESMSPVKNEKKKSMSPIKNGMTTPVLNPAAVVSDSTVRKKRGRPRKIVLNPLSLEQQPTSGTQVPSKSPITPKIHIPNTPKTVSFSVSETKRKIKVEPVDRLTETPKSGNSFSSVTIRTSKRKRQSTEKMSEYMSTITRKSKAPPLKMQVESKSPRLTSLSPSFYSATKKIPKKTILERIDHKPDLSKALTFAQPKSPLYKSTPKSKIGVSVRNASLDRISTIVNTVTQERAQARSISSNVDQMIYRKNAVSSIVNDDIHTNGIFESLNDSDSQFFVTTIPLKCPEFVQTRNEFLGKGGDIEACATGLDSHLAHAVDSSEKLTEDGKYQILTNVCPDTLASIDGAASLLLHIGS